MECLYQVTERNTLEEVEKLYWALFWKNRKSVITMVICEVVYLGLAGYYFYWWYTVWGILFVALAVAYPLIFRARVKRNLKKNFETDKVTADLERHYEFYEDEVRVFHTHGQSRVKYSEICGVLETKTNFYLKLSRTSAFFLRKENMPEGMDQFLRNLDPKKA